MTELEIMQRAKLYMDLLAQGVDPISRRQLPADTALNNERLSQCFLYVSEVLGRVIANGGSVGEIVRKNPFRITPQQLFGVMLSQEPIRVTQLTERIWEAAGDIRMKKPNTTLITNWLLAQGFLESREMPEGKYTRLPTEKGRKIGLSAQSRMGSEGEYHTVYYSLEAQRFVLDHLFEILFPNDHP